MPRACTRGRYLIRFAKPQQYEACLVELSRMRNEFTDLGAFEPPGLPELSLLLSRVRTCYISMGTTLR